MDTKILPMLKSLIQNDSTRKTVALHTCGCETHGRKADCIAEVYSVAQLCLTLCNPMDCSQPGSSIHGIFQVIMLEWVAISFSRGLSDSGIEPRFHALAGGFFIAEPPRKPHCLVRWLQF